MHRRGQNQILVRFLVLPTLFLTVALLGGLRVGGATGAFLFIAPPLVTLLLAVLLMLLFLRGRLLELSRWLSGEHPPLTNVAHALTLAALFFASAQAFNSVLPERGLFRWMLGCFFLWTLWNNLFSAFDARRLLRSLAALFGAAFVLNHLLLASLYAPGDAGWLKQIAGALVEGVTKGTLGAQEKIAPATGYISFFTLALYVGGLVLLLPSAPDAEHDRRPAVQGFLTEYQQLSQSERALVRDALLRAEQKQLNSTPREQTETIETEIVAEKSDG
ncbi:MAG: hypothetical protein M3Q76_08710 [Acidobacteriota bacterium]|nr:hypothetical protein [Acidobacteriota bacterium]